MNPLSTPPFEPDARRWDALLRVADAVALRRDPGELFEEVAPLLRVVVPFNLVNFSLVHPSRKTMKMFLWEGEEWPREPLEIAIGETAVGYVWRNQAVLSIDDLSREKRFEPGLLSLRQRNVRSYCVVPLTTFHEKLGALGFGSERPSAFGASDVEFLYRAARLLALCVDASLSETALAEETARLRLLFELGTPRLHGSDLGHSVSAVLESMQKWAAQDYVGVYLYDGVSQALRLHMADPHVVEKMAPQGLAAIEGTLAGQAFNSGQSVVLDHAGLTELSLPSVRRGLEQGIKSLYLAPILSQYGPLGVLKVARREDQPFSPRDVELLERGLDGCACIRAWPYGETEGR